jgi:hypothetical protein
LASFFSAASGAVVPVVSAAAVMQQHTASADQEQDQVGQESVLPMVLMELHRELYMKDNNTQWDLCHQPHHHPSTTILMCFDRRTKRCSGRWKRAEGNMSARFLNRLST